MFEESFQGVAGMFQGSFKGVQRKFFFLMLQGRLKGVSMEF